MIGPPTPNLYDCEGQLADSPLRLHCDRITFTIRLSPPERIHQFHPAVVARKRERQLCRLESPGGLHRNRTLLDLRSCRLASPLHPGSLRQIFPWNVNTNRISALSLRSVPAEALRPTGPAAMEASAPILNLSLIRLCSARSFMKRKLPGQRTNQSDPATDAPSIDRYKHGGAPAVRGATGCHSPPVAAAKYEGEFLVPWNDC